MEAAQIAWCGEQIVLNGSRATVHHQASLVSEGAFPEDPASSGLGAVSAIGHADGSPVVVHKKGVVVHRGVAADMVTGERGSVVWAGVRALGPKSVTGVSRCDLEAKARQCRTGDVVVVFAWVNAEGKEASLRVYNMRTAGSVSVWTDATRTAVVKKAAASSRDPHTVAVAVVDEATKKHSVHVVLLGSGGEEHVLACQNPVSSLSVHPFKEQVSVGDVQGRIRTWLLPNKIMKEVHWHAHDVAVLEWSPDGTVLLSGGEEAVLCLWNARTWEHSKIARLGGSIVSAAWADDSATVVVAMTPSQLTLVDVIQKKPVRTVHGADILKGQPCTRLHTVATPTVQCVALYGAGVSNCIRVFDPTTRSYIKTLRTATVNAVSRVDAAPLPSLEVNLMDVSTKGDHLVTVEESDVSTFQQAKETTLRFWHSTADASLDYKVNTYVTNPYAAHAPTTTSSAAPAASPTSDVTGLALSRARNHCFTLSRGGCVKKWVFSSSGQHWRHAAELDLTCREALSLSVSPDGTVVSVCHDAGVTNLRASDLSVLSVLHQHQSAQPLRASLYVTEGQRSLLAAHSSTHLFLWDVPTASLLYALELPLDCFTPTPDGASFVAAACGALLLFTGSAAAPRAVHELAGGEGENVRDLHVPRIGRGGSAALNTVLYVGADRVLAHVSSTEIEDFLKGVSAQAEGDDAASPSAAAATAAAPAGSALRGLFHVPQQAGAAGAAAQAELPQSAIRYLPKAFENPSQSCKQLATFYEGDTHSLQAPAASLDVLLSSLLTFE